MEVTFCEESMRKPELFKILNSFHLYLFRVPDLGILGNPFQS